MKERKLNARQLRFAQEYLVDLNATQAAIRSGYSKLHPDVQGSSNLKHPEILKEIQRLQTARSKRTDIDADWVLYKLAEIAEANLADFMVIPENGDPYFDLGKATKQQIALLETCQFDTSTTDAGKLSRIKIGLSNRLKALELIGKHVDVQAFRDRIDRGDPDGSPIKMITINMSSDDAAKIYVQEILSS